ncbi:FAD-dependent oxidoreductase [Variovorax sp. J22P168]|nr:FAD-dependent oxidoreductase [Variovorax sp. J22P168]
MAVLKADRPDECHNDLVVVGAGAAGMTAALVAALHGLKVTLLEATEQVGGTTSTSAGTLWIPGSSHGTRAGHGDSLDEARTYLDALIGPDDPQGLRTAYLSCAAEAIDYLEANSSVEFRSAGTHPDYLELPGAAMAGRAISPVEFDGRRLGNAFFRVRPPMPHFMVLGGMMVGKADISALLGRFRSTGKLLHTARLLSRYALDRLRGYRRGTRLVMGNALVARLLMSLQQAGVTVLYGMRCESLVHEAGRVSGARIRRGESGESRVIGSTAGVVLCTGGVGHSSELRRAFGTDVLQSRSLSFEGNRGEGITAALAVGAALERSTPDFLWQPVSLVPERAGRQSLYPHLFLDRAKPGLLAVDRAGRRFVNEGASYHHFVEAMRLASEKVQGPAPAYLICNVAFVKQYGLGAIHPGKTDLGTWVERGYVAVADTFEALARKLGIEAEGLESSVRQMNEAAVQGGDVVFGKGSTAVSRFNGDPDQVPNPCLAPLIEGPYVGLEIWPGESASSSGISTTADGEVLTASGLVVPGLYACGNDMASIWRGTYPGPGATLGPAMVFAYRLVRGIVAKRQR